MRSAGNKILVVEDDDDWQQIVRLWLKTGGYGEARFASTGKEAMELLKEFTPDCIILDLQLPDTDGAALCKRIRALPAAAKVPIIVLTNFPGERAMCLKAGACLKI